MLALLLGISIFLINATNKIIMCSAFFTLSLFITNIITESYSKKKAISVLTFCVLVNAALAWQKFNVMLVIYFASLLFSFYCSVNLLERLKPQLNFSIRNYISSIISVLIDVGILTVVHLLIGQFPLYNVITIGAKSLIYKVLYTSIISFAVSISSKMSRQEVKA
ncbi:hypothetical protein BIY23_03555 [Wolbachia pipientis]|uniref:VUT family protein n=1 Tax=Wolbachia pipientis TaxID=955 RepID=A0A1E7QJ40_WOLPI|nr:hypothetical protein [Wolbachia pipientis]OEY86480.1 hypothetical protein BIY23_03555 [Wolbachia pipientis]